MTVKMITVWYKYNNEGSEARLNHIEDGWVNGEYPKPIDPSFSSQEAWEKSSWEKKHGYLNEQYQVLGVPPAFWCEN